MWTGYGLPINQSSSFSLLAIFESTRMARANDNQLVGGFNFTLAMRYLCADMCQRLPELHHIDLERVAISFCQARKNVSHGLQASLTPLRFEHGATTIQRGSRQYSCQPVRDHNGLEYFYILSFYIVKP